METISPNNTLSITASNKNVAALIHLSTFSKYFIPFGNFIAPILLWTTNRDNIFVDEHGKQAINFQLSILVYMLLIGILCIPFVIIMAGDFINLIELFDRSNHNIQLSEIKNISGYIVLGAIVGLLFLGLLFFELYAVINASIHANRGENYKYPFCIPFIKTNQLNQSKNEQFI